MEMITGRKQQSRALQLILTQDYVYYGTDTPYEMNHIRRINKRTGKVETLADLDGSVYWGCKVGGIIFFSTAVEPSKINRYRYASLWCSQDGINWIKIEKYKKDLWPMKYGQIGQIYLPQGENETGYLFYTPIATKYNLTLQKLRIDDLF